MAKKDATKIPDVVPYRILWYGMNTDGSQYKRYNPRFGVTYEGMETYITLDVPGHYFTDIRETGKGTKKKIIYTLTPQGVMWVCKALATLFAIEEANFKLD